MIGAYYEKISQLFGKWFSEEFHTSWGACSDWQRYWNYTFYNNYTVNKVSNWCDISSGEETWDISWISYFIDEEEWLAYRKGIWYSFLTISVNNYSKKLHYIHSCYYC